MTYTVYGLRLKGSPEPRYIGQTRHTPDKRLEGHLTASRNMPLTDAFADWLLWCPEAIEAFAIDVFPDREAARACERMMIEACTKLGHRLFNCHYVPADKRHNRRSERVVAFRAGIERQHQAFLARAGVSA